MKRGLVLGGGGAKGAYQAGCIQALQELNQNFDLVTGTSIGALNGLLVVQQDYDALYNLWKTITHNDVFVSELPTDLSFESVLNNHASLLSFISSYIEDQSIDITPLITIMNRLYNPSIFLTSKIDYGLVTTKYPQLKPCTYTKEVILDQALDYAIASASCFPVFPIKEINDQKYIDGGYSDNLPISLAFTMGATTVVAIALNKEDVHPQYKNRSNVTLIVPTFDLKTFFDFSRNTLDFRYQLGYLDTCRVFKKYFGYKYAFLPESCDLQDDFYLTLLAYEDRLCSTKLPKIISSLPITIFLQEYCSKQTVECIDYTIVGLELLLEQYQYDTLTIYDYTKTRDSCITSFINQYHTEFLVNKNEQSFNWRHYSDLAKNFSSQEIMFYIFFCLKTKEEDHSTLLSSLFTKEYLIARYVLFHQ